MVWFNLGGYMRSRHAVWEDIYAVILNGEAVTAWYDDNTVVYL